VVANEGGGHWNGGINGGFDSIAVTIINKGRGSAGSASDIGKAVFGILQHSKIFNLVIYKKYLFLLNFETVFTSTLLTFKMINRIKRCIKLKLFPISE
jgi:hypothetical protein